MQYSDEECRKIVAALQSCLDTVLSGQYIAHAIGLCADETADGLVIAVIASDLWPQIAAVIEEASGAGSVRIAEYDGPMSLPFVRPEDTDECE